MEIKRKKEVDWYRIISFLLGYQQKRALVIWVWLTVNQSTSKQI